MTCLDGWVDLGRGGGQGCLSETDMHKSGGLLYMHENRAHRVGVGVDGRLEGRMDGGLEGGLGGKMEGWKSGRMEGMGAGGRMDSGGRMNARRYAGEWHARRHMARQWMAGMDR